MSLVSLATVVPLSTEGEGGIGAWPYVIGGGVLLLLLVLLLGLMAIGKGREHS